jgi:NADH-quinone oxidoreductase subunit C
VTENTSENTNAVAAQLRAWNGKAVSEVIEFRGETTLVVPREMMLELCAHCLRDPNLQFNLLTDATCVDRFPMEPRFEVSYHLVSIPRKARLRLKTKLPGSDPVMDSMVPVWPGANWLEREIWDLMGIRFNGHPDLRRILLPDDWEGHPLRKDFPVQGFRDVPSSYIPAFRKPR